MICWRTSFRICFFFLILCLLTLHTLVTSFLASCQYFFASFHHFFKLLLRWAIVARWKSILLNEIISTSVAFLSSDFAFALSDVTFFLLIPCLITLVLNFLIFIIHTAILVKKIVLKISNAKNSINIKNAFNRKAWINLGKAAISVSSTRLIKSSANFKFFNNSVTSSVAWQLNTPSQIPKIGP